MAKWIGLITRIILIDNHIRWNSQYRMLTILIEKMKYVDKYCRNYEEDLIEDFLSYKDQKKLHITRDFLTTFIRATLFAEGASTSINHTLFIIDILIKYLHEIIISLLLSFFLLIRAKLNIIQAKFKKKRDNESKEFLVQLNITYTILNKYYTRTNLSPFYAIALILNPGFCTRYIRANQLKKYVTLALISIKKFQEYYRD